MPIDPSSLSALPGNLHQAGRDQYFFSAHAESGGVATAVNNLFIYGLERRWLKPAPPRLERDAVPRTAEMQAVLNALAERESVAITGQAARAQALAVQGAPGVGKTTLAHLLALQLADDERYRDGVIWQELGPDFRSPDQAQPVLRAWAGHATGFFGLPDNLNKLFVFEPEAVRSLLAEHPRLLVVLDNVWSLAAIQPLRKALPAGSHLIITTRSREIALELAGGLVEVGLLSRDEAMALFELHLRWRLAEGSSGDGWAADLMQAVGFHALGLDVALGVLLRYGDGAADWETTARRLIAAVHSGEVERLSLGDDDPGHNVKAVILFSYQALPDAETRRRLRTLAAFAPESELTTALAAAAWGCDEESAFETLTGFANAALLDRLGGGLWRQHGLLRSFGAALLRDAGERDQAAAAHARAYLAAMRAADDEQRYYQMLPAMPQLRHAFEWALANDLELALSIAANCANVQNQFGQTRQAGEWAERLLAAAQASRVGPATLARAFGHRANRMSAIATLPGEDRRARLTQALRCAAEAVALFQQFQQAQYLEVGKRVLQSIRRACGDDFAALWAAAGLGEPPDWLLETEDDDASPSMQDLLVVFAQIGNQDRMIAFWQAMPTAMEEPFMQAVEAWIAQAEAAGDQGAVEHLRSRLEGFRAIRAGAARSLAAREPLLQEYQEALQAADAENPQVAEWQAITELDERLLAMQAGAENLLNWNALCEQLASDYNTLGNAHDDAGDKAASLAAFERAIALQPDFAMFHRNRASTLIELGRLDAARAALDQARALQPDAPRLANLEAALAKAQEGAGN